jgi:hypothetical protein
MTVPFVRQFTVGATGTDCRAVKRALAEVWAATPVTGMDLTGDMFEEPAGDYLATFKRDHGLLQDPVYTVEAHAALSPFFDTLGIQLLKDEAATLALEAEDALRAAFCATAARTITLGRLFGYSELIGAGPGERDFFLTAPIDTTGTDWAAFVASHGKLTSDCGSHYFACGAHTAGFSWGSLNVDGNTATLLSLPETTAADAKPGDGVIFTGPQFPGGQHITGLYKKLPSGDWQTFNNGGPAGAPPSWSTLSAQTQWQAANGAPVLNWRRLPV